MLEPIHNVTVAGTEVQSFQCHSDDTLMRAAQRQGIAFPYECNVGACGNCKFELIEGEVETKWPEAPGWSERDRQKNRYLGCQCMPKGDCTIKFRPNDQYAPVHTPRVTTGTLIARRAITYDIDEFCFSLADNLTFEPGQYALLSLPGVQGQRAYSMSNIAAQNTESRELHFQIRRVPNGKGTGVLFDSVEIGAQIEIDGPYGMAYLRRHVKRDIVLLAGGSGLAPMISIARGVMTDPNMADVKVDFIYGGRTPRDICGQDMLTELPGFGTRLRYHGAVSGLAQGDPWDGPMGYAHEIAHSLHGENLRDMEIYFAGPPAMGTAIQKALIELKMPFGQVHFDQFY
jgi:toluene monooxygenase electron transfer component